MYQHNSASCFIFFFFFNDTATTEIYTVSDTLSLHDALPISSAAPSSPRVSCPPSTPRRRLSARWRSEEHTSELQSPDTISYAVFCLKKKKPLHHQTKVLFIFHIKK